VDAFMLENPGLQTGACANLCIASTRVIGLLVITTSTSTTSALLEIAVQRSGAKVAALSIATGRSTRMQRPRIASL
jgi:hypothetical protein